MPDYTWIILFFIVGLLFGGGAFFASFLLRPKREGKQGLSTYECGELPTGSPYIQYNAKYYLYGLIFLIFDVEVVFILPWAIIFRNSTISPIVLFIEMMLFIAILLIGLGYAWRKGVLKWE